MVSRRVSSLSLRLFSWVHLGRNDAPRFATVGGMEKLRQVVTVPRNGPAVRAVHKVELNHVFAASEELLQSLSCAGRFPRDAAVVRAIQGPFDGCGRTGAMRFGSPHPAFPRGDEAPEAVEFDGRAGLPAKTAVMGAVDDGSKTGRLAVRRLVLGRKDSLVAVPSKESRQPDWFHPAGVERGRQGEVLHLPVQPAIPSDKKKTGCGARQGTADPAGGIVPKCYRPTADEVRMASVEFREGGLFPDPSVGTCRRAVDAQPMRAAIAGPIQISRGGIHAVVRD